MPHKLLNTVYGQPHAILPDKLDTIAGIIERREAGAPPLTDAETAAAVGAVDAPEAYALNAEGECFAVGDVTSGQAGRNIVAVVPMFGVLGQHTGMQMRASGGTSTDQLKSTLTSLDQNPDIGSIVLHVHSPGGSVFGVQELTNAIYSIREAGNTRIVTAVNSMAASAAVWTSTAANEVVVTPGGEMGSIGVVSMHRDVSEAMEKAGIKTTLLAYPAKKVEGNSYEPLSEEVATDILNRNKQVYDVFVSHVARNRGVSAEVVEQQFGSGGMLNASESVAAGLADRIATIDEVVGELVDSARQASARNRRRAQLAKAELDSMN